MGILYALIIGLFVGALAKLIMPGRDPGGIIITALLGVTGSFLAFFLGSVSGWYSHQGDGPGIFASVIGAMIVLGVHRILVARRVRVGSRYAKWQARDRSL